MAYTRDVPYLEAVRLKGVVLRQGEGRLTWGQCSVGIRSAGEDAYGVCAVVLFGTIKGTGEHWEQVLTLLPVRSCGAATGERYLLRCPSCSKLRRSLYFLCKRFLCRECHGLKYRTQSLSPLDRAYQSQAKVGKKINPNADGTDFPRRPVGMQRRPFDKLLRQWCKADMEREEVANRELIALARNRGWV